MPSSKWFSSDFDSGCPTSRDLNSKRNSWGVIAPLWQGDRCYSRFTLWLCSDSHSPVVVLSIDKSFIDTRSALAQQRGRVPHQLPAMSLEGGRDGPPLLEQASELPLSLLDLLSNSLIFDIVVPQ